MTQNFLKKIRESKNIGQSELARLVGVSKQLICGFENGRSGISNEVLRKIAETLQIKPSQIIDGKSPHPFDQSGRDKLTKAMSMSFSFYADEFDKETLIKIATEIYVLMLDFEEMSLKHEDSDLEDFLKEKITIGLAAKCLLNSKD